MARQYAKDQPAGYKNRIEKVAIVGAGGRSGAPIVKALLAGGKHTITAITREGSTNAIPAGLQKKTVNYDDESSLVAALEGQDAFIITMSRFAPRDASTKLIKAAAAAKVPWLIPNEFGNDTAHAALRKDTFIGEANYAHRQLAQSLGLNFVGICCGFWFDHSLSIHPNAFGFDIPNRKVTFYDDGKNAISTSTLDFCGLATAKVLGLKILPEDENDKSPCLDDFRNRGAYVEGLKVSQRDMFEAVLRETGTSEGDWTIMNQPVKERYESGLKEFQGGEQLGLMKLLYARVFYPDKCGDFEASHTLDNVALGLTQESLEDCTKVAVQRSYNPDFS